MATKTKNIKDYIQSFCAVDGYRPALEKQVLINGFVYATDANKGIKVKADHINYTVDENPEYPGLEKVWNEIQTIEDFSIPISTIKAALSKIELIPAKKDCDECEGTGKIECFHCGHDSECEECDGEGTIEMEGVLAPDYDSYTAIIKDVQFNPSYIADLVEGMEIEGQSCLIIKALDRHRAALFTIGKLEVLLMPYSPHSGLFDEEHTLILI